MKSACIILTLFFWSSILSQTKKEKFYNESGLEVSKEKFRKSIDHKVNIDSYFTNDSVIVGQLHSRINYSKLTLQELKSLQSYLFEISGRQVDSEKVIVINYFPGEDRIDEGKSQAYIYQDNYMKKLIKEGNILQYWIYSSAINLEHHHRDRLIWLHDKKRIVERVFFPAYFRFGSTAVIMPDGRYYTYFGEYGPDEVFAGLNQLKKNAN